MPLSIIGVGLPRTGTTSLVKALNILGFRAVHYEPERLLAVGRKLSWRVYDDVDAAADFPAAPYYREILKEYPACRVILTLREPREAWLDSVIGHGKAMHSSIQEDKGYVRFMLAVGREWWGGELGADLRGAMARYYMRWREQVMQDVPPLQLLRLYVGDGWERLCRFLDRPIPDVPYPWEKQRPPQ